MDEEGYIKFNCNWIKSEPLSKSELGGINLWRKKLYGLGLIGAYSDGTGFGNISIRLGNSNNFIISGSATGNLKSLTEQHYTRVIDFDLRKNRLTCSGPVIASSESLTHAAIYKTDKDANAVIHVHNLKLWRKLVNKIPTTSKYIAYGTPEMANEVIKLFSGTDVRNKKILAMGGHKEGIVSFGRDLNDAGKTLLAYLN